MRLVTLMLSAFVAAGCGCAIKPLIPFGSDRITPQEVTQHAPRQTPIGVWYAVEPLMTDDEQSLPAAVSQDFEQISRLGFNTVFVRHLDNAQRREVLDLARKFGLQIVLPNRDVIHYVRSGIMPDGCHSAADVVDRSVSQVEDHPALALHYIGRVTSPDMFERAREVGNAIMRRGGAAPFVELSPDACQVNDPDNPFYYALYMRLPAARTASDTQTVHWKRYVDHGPYSKLHLDSDVRRLQTIACRAVPGLLSVPEGNELFYLYHAGLLQGATGGLVLDGFRTVPGRGSGLADHDGQMPISRVAAIKKLIERASTWGKYIKRRKPEPIDYVEGAGQDIQTVLFRGRFSPMVLAFNASENRFAHRKIILPTSMGGRTFQKAVERESGAGAGGGQVFKAGPKGIEIKIDLSPGQAALYELF